MTRSARALIALPVLGAMLFALGGFGPRTPAPLPRNFSLKSASADLPQDYEQMFPDGPDVEAVNTNCRACHSPSMVLVQPKLSRAAWEKVVTKMVTTYRAPIPASDVPQIVNYLEHIPS